MMQNTGKAAPVGDRLFCCFNALIFSLLGDVGLQLEDNNIDNAQG
jgi:hypothetical protein